LLSDDQDKEENQRETADQAEVQMDIESENTNMDNQGTIEKSTPDNSTTRRTTPYNLRNNVIPQGRRLNKLGASFIEGGG